MKEMKCKNIYFNYINERGEEKRKIQTFSKVHTPQFKTIDLFIDYLYQKYPTMKNLKIEDSTFITL